MSTEAALPPSSTTLSETLCYTGMYTAAAAGMGTLYALTLTTLSPAVGALFGATVVLTYTGSDFLTTTVNGCLPLDSFTSRTVSCVVAIIFPVIAAFFAGAGAVAATGAVATFGAALGFAATCILVSGGVIAAIAAVGFTIICCCCSGSSAPDAVPSGQVAPDAEPSPTTQT